MLAKLEPLVDMLTPFIAFGNQKMKEAIEELRGIAEVTRVPLSLILAFNFMEEFATMCTSLVIRTPSGRALLARNLDFDFAPLLSALTYDAVFTRKGKELFRASMFAGSVGVFTG